ncbi:DHA2 family efflux MFS transporter permease subunit [Cohnella caldifontis]|uniref:DHA2 family efflux MFS transporter permease subunit n=1 Tax=Cohnella caldifontis TaxID=3027471 RepID=UPI0023EB470F|nr:DHA2 family efflux MFS transporter permease subunit [Cohnella sp. YIM B05605]
MKNAQNRRWWVLAALSFGLMAVGLDMTVLNVALPTLAADLQASTGELQWFADAYNLALAAALLPAGMLGDRYGRKKWLLIALVLFGAASAACAYSDSSGMLILMRAFLGLGAAFLIPLSMSVLPVLFREEERTRAMMVWAMANMLGIPLGPIVGGWLLKHYDWGSVFLLNLPLVVIAICAVAWLMPESRRPDRPRLDAAGALASSLGLTALTYGVIRAGERGWDEAAALWSVAAGAVLLVCFLVWQKRYRHALIEMSLFRSRGFTWGAALATLVSFAIFGLLFALPQYFQAISGVDSFATGLRLLPLIGGLMLGARASDRLMSAAGAKLTVAAGFVFLAAGLMIGTATGIDSGYGFIAFWIVVAGIGLGLSLPAAMASALNQLSAERSGTGSALIMAFRQVGGTVGVALLGSALNRGYRGELHIADLPDAVASAVRRGVSAGVAASRQIGSDELLAQVHHAFLHGMSLLLWVSGGIALLGLVLALLFLPGRSAGTTHDRPQAAAPAEPL